MESFKKTSFSSSSTSSVRDEYNGTINIASYEKINNDLSNSIVDDNLCAEAFVVGFEMK